MSLIGKLVVFLPNIERPENWEAADDLEKYFSDHRRSFTWETILDSVSEPCLVIKEFSNGYVRLLLGNLKELDFPASCLKIVKYK